MNVVLPIRDGKVLLVRGSDGYLRPAMGKGNAGTVATEAFGAHGFTELIGKVHFSGETFEFYRVDVAQMIPTTKVSKAAVIETPTAELIGAMKGNVVLNIFLDLAIRMYCDLVE